MAPPPAMDLIGGPQGGGKSTLFPVKSRGYVGFNIDEHKRALNKGSSASIPEEVQAQARNDYERFVTDSIAERRSFSIEVTLARDITFEQAAKAMENGFLVHLAYVAAPLETCLDRVAKRRQLGGHGVSPDVHRDTYTASMRNLSRAIDTFSFVNIFDNSHKSTSGSASTEIAASRLLAYKDGHLTYRHKGGMPDWITDAFKNTKHMADVDGP